MFKCYECKIILDETDLNPEGFCPECDGAVVEMCPNDVGWCSHGVVSGTKTCDICGAFICPECGNHDVEALSRTTGYYAPLSAFGAGKRAEFMDRVRYTV